MPFERSPIVAQNDREKWTEFYNIVMETVDIEATCGEWGIEFTGGVTDGGWAECRAANRDDRRGGGVAPGCK